MEPKQDAKALVVVKSRFALILGVYVAWSACSLAPIWKYLSHPAAAVVTLVGLMSLSLGMYGLTRLNQERRHISQGWFLLLFLVLATAFTVLYPLSLKNTLKARSDREDALRIELVALRQHQYPYAARTFLGNPPTPLPGALLLAAPFFSIGHIAWQNLLWVGFFFYFAIHFFRHRATALLLLGLFLLFSPSILSDFTSGGDYLTNFFYVAIAIACFVRSLDYAYPISMLAAVFLGLCLSSRGIYAVVLIPLFVLALQRNSRLRAAILFGVILLAAALVTLPVFMPHPLTNLLLQLNENPGKLRYIPYAFHPAAHSAAARTRGDLRCHLYANGSPSSVSPLQRLQLRHARTTDRYAGLPYGKASI